MGYGTGAIMAVPGHDGRDFAFARKYGLEIRQVITWPDASYDVSAWQDRYADRGTLVHSGGFDGLTSDAAYAAMVEMGKEQGCLEPSRPEMTSKTNVSSNRFAYPVPLHGLDTFRPVDSGPGRQPAGQRSRLS